MKNGKFNKKDLAKFVLQITEKDDPYWERCLESAIPNEDDWYNEKEDKFLVSIYDVLSPLGFSKEELKEIEVSHIIKEEYL